MEVDVIDLPKRLRLRMSKLKELLDRIRVSCIVDSSEVSMAKKRSVKVMEAELTQLKKQIEVAKQQEMIKEVISTPEFKKVAKQFARLNIPPAVITTLFTATGKTARTVKKTRAKVPPKYKHPDNQKLLWSGRGSKPLWVKECLEKGLTMDDLLIKK